MEIVKKNWVTILMSVGTVVLAVVAIFTAMRLYQLRSQPVAPNVPESEPAAADAECPANTCEGKELCLSYAEQSTQQCGTGGEVCKVCSAGQVCSDGVCAAEQTSCEAVEFSIGGPTSTPTLTPTPTATATSTAATITPTPTATSRIGATATPTTGPTSLPLVTSSPTAVPSLPEAGVGLPAIAGVGAGAILVILGLLLAL